MDVQCIMKVKERDMDLLFMQSFSSDPGFADLFVSETPLAGKQYQVCSVELSKRDADFGESDITVILQLENDNKKHALLIEDKIDAIDMPQQKERYTKRGDQGIQDGDYDGYDVFIVCPDKYHESNAEATKYNFFISYETILDYFKAKDPADSARIQQMEQALQKAKKHSQTRLHEIAVKSFKMYAEYQWKNYPSLELQNRVHSGKVNGWWPRFFTSAPGAYIIHKAPQGYVDLTFSGMADKKDVLKRLLPWLNREGAAQMKVCVTGKSAALRIEVPEIHMEQEFEDWDMNELKQCFDAILQLTQIAEQIGLILQLFDK